MHRTTLRDVNSAPWPGIRSASCAALGISTSQAGGTAYWPVTGVYVFRLSAYTSAGWVHEFHALRSDSRNAIDARDSAAKLGVKCAHCPAPAVTNFKKGAAPSQPVCRACCERLLAEDRAAERPGYGQAD